MIRRLSAFVVIAILLSALSALGSTFLAVTRADLVRDSDSVVVGTVIATRSFWNADASLIVTEATVAIGETLVGDAPSQVVIRTFGGEVGNYRVVAHGFPQFDEEDEVLLFLKRDPKDRSIRVLGYQQGHYSIERDQRGVEMAVPTVDSGARLLYRDGRLAPRPQPQALDILKASIRAEGRRMGRPVK